MFSNNKNILSVRLFCHREDRAIFFLINYYSYFCGFIILKRIKYYYFIYNPHIYIFIRKFKSKYTNQKKYKLNKKIINISRYTF